jgi:ABC-type thiamine transport system ATPase subunit
MPGLSLQQPIVLIQALAGELEEDFRRRMQRLVAVLFEENELSVVTLVERVQDTLICVVALASHLSV